MPQYLIFFNQQWVGDHTEEWFASRGPLASAVVDEIRDAGALIYAGGLEEDHASTCAFEPDGDQVRMRPGRHVDTGEFVGGLTIVDVPDDASAQKWARKIAVACGWPQELRRFGG